MNNPITVPKPFYGWINAGLLTFVYMASTGLVFYAFSVIFPVMLNDTGWSRGDASIAISVATLVAGFSIPLVAKLLNVWGSRKVIIIGLAITLLNLILLSTVVTKPWHWILIWGFMIPVGRQLSGLLPSQLNIMFWFSRKRAMAIGLLMTGAPIGGFFAPPIYTWFMAHMGGWRFGWMLSAGMVFIALVLSFLVKSKPSDIGQHPDGIKPSEAKAGGGDGPSDDGVRTFRTDKVWTIKEVLKTRTIWLLTAANVSQGLCLGLVINHGVLHLRDIGYEPIKAAFILSAIIISSGVVRFPMGWLGDRIEPRWIFFSALLLMLFGFIGIWKAPSYVLLLVVGAVYGSCYGTILTISPTLAGNYYGPEVFPSIRGFFAPWLTIVTASIPTLAGYAQEKLGSYDEVFLALTIILVGGIICAAFLSPPQKKVKPL